MRNPDGNQSFMSLFRNVIINSPFMHRCLCAAVVLCISASVFAQANFVLEDTTGQRHALSDYKGKWVVINYWATWCPPCLEEIPDLVNLYDQRKQRDLMVIGVVFEYKNRQEVADYVDDMLMSYPIVLGNAKIAQQIGSAEVLPTTYVYDPQGRLVKIKRGPITRQYLEQLMSVSR
jgi:thiol-disulfide isomerase/thioredoxin